MRVNECLAIRGVYLCEEFRGDDKGQPFIVGLMLPSFYVSKFPLKLPGITGFGQVRLLGEAPLLVEVSIQNEKGTVIEEAELRLLPAREFQFFRFAIPGPISFQEPGKYTVCFRPKGGAVWQEVADYVLQSPPESLAVNTALYSNPEFQKELQELIEKHAKQAASP